MNQIFVLICVILSLYSITLTEAVQRSKFKTCNQNAFCHRLRNINQHKADNTWYINPKDVNIDASLNTLESDLYNKQYPNQPPLKLSVNLLAQGAARVRVVENDKIVQTFGPRWEAADDILSPQFLISSSDNVFTVPKQSKAASVTLANNNKQVLSDSESSASVCSFDHQDNEYCIIIEFTPYVVLKHTFNGLVTSVVNSDNFFHFEQHHSKNPKPVDNPSAVDSTFPFDNIHTYSETFDKYTDSKPNGDEGFSIDIAFPYAEEVYGLPEHASSYALKRTYNLPKMAKVSTIAPQDNTVNNGLPSNIGNTKFNGINGQGVYAEPYRLYNLDVFEYELNEPMALYGSIPFLHTQSGVVDVVYDKNNIVSTPISSGVFVLNAGEMYVDIYTTDLKPTHTSMASPSSPSPSSLSTSTSVSSEGRVNSPSVHFMAETGVIDMILFAATSSSSIQQQYTLLTSRPSLPPRFSLGHHQCRWNYISSEDTMQVNDQMFIHDVPTDVLWLDIEHTDGKRYATWDYKYFPKPLEMQNHLESSGRSLVNIVDPHIKADNQYSVYKDALVKNMYVENPQGTTYYGHCWSGNSAYLDFSRLDVNTYWVDVLSASKYKDTTEYLSIWNDMNEPSVFSGPEVTMGKDNLHNPTKGVYDINKVGVLRGKVEHRQLHNMYGYYYHQATVNALIQRRKNVNKDMYLPSSPPVVTKSITPPITITPTERAFVLSRSFFAGSQKLSAIWTGDNAATWAQLESTVPMLLSLNSASMVFSGADIGGFFGQVDAELITRWYQSAILQPFFRNHAHIDSKRREPWMFDAKTLKSVRTSIKQRYSLLSHLYTSFAMSNTTGIASMFGLNNVFPFDNNILTKDNSYIVGGLVITPVVTPKARRIIIDIPRQPTIDYVNSIDTATNNNNIEYESVSYYNYQSQQCINCNSNSHARMTLATPLSVIPILQVSGSTVFYHSQVKRNSWSTVLSPVFLNIALLKKSINVNRNYIFNDISVDDAVVDNAALLSHGNLYVDDGMSYAFKQGAYATRQVYVEQHTPICSKCSNIRIVGRSSKQFQYDAVKNNRYNYLNENSCVGGGLVSPSCILSLKNREKITLLNQKTASRSTKISDDSLDTLSASLLKESLTHNAHIKLKYNNNINNIALLGWNQLEQGVKNDITPTQAVLVFLASGVDANNSELNTIIASYITDNSYTYNRLISKIINVNIKIVGDTLIIPKPDINLIQDFVIYFI